MTTLTEAAGAGRLPRFDPIPAHGDMAEGEFFFTPYQVNVQTHSYTANCMFLSEILSSLFKKHYPQKILITHRQVLILRHY